MSGPPPPTFPSVCTPTSCSSGRALSWCPGQGMVILEKWPEDFSRWRCCDLIFYPLPCFLSLIAYLFTFHWRRQWHPTPVLLPRKSHGWRSLVGCSPWGREESDTTAQLHFHFSLSCIGEGNGNPLQCSCLENPRDGGAWWVAVHGVAESDTTEAT